jgi:hypothetical protein
MGDLRKICDLFFFCLSRDVLIEYRYKNITFIVFCKEREVNVYITSQWYLGMYVSFTVYFVHRVYLLASYGS